MNARELPKASVDRWANTRKRMWELTEKLSSDIDLRNRLNDGCEAVMTQYMLGKTGSASREDHAGSRKLLSSMANQAQGMIADYHRLKSEFQVGLIYARRDAPDVVDRDSTFFFSLLTELHDFAVTAKWLEERVPPKSVGAPGEILRRNTLNALVDIVEDCTGETVTYSRWKSGDDDPHFVGNAGEFVRDVFQAIDPTITERQLANALRNLKERVRSKRKTEN